MKASRNTGYGADAVVYSANVDGVDVDSVFDGNDVEHGYRSAYFESFESSRFRSISGIYRTASAPGER